MPQSTFRAIGGLLLEPIRVAAAMIRYLVLNWPDTRLGIALRREYVTLKVAAVGENFRLMKGCSIAGYHLVHIGNNSGIAQDVVVVLGPGNKELRIGDRSFIGPGTYIRNMNHRFDKVDLPISDQGHEGTDILIGNDVWVGARCILLPGTKIGDHSVIAAGSVVSSEIPPYSVAAGNPVRVVRRRLVK